MVPQAQTIGLVLNPVKTLIDESRFLETDSANCAQVAGLEGDGGPPEQTTENNVLLDEVAIKLQVT